MAACIIFFLRSCHLILCVLFVPSILLLTLCTAQAVMPPKLQKDIRKEPHRIHYGIEDVSIENKEVYSLNPSKVQDCQIGPMTMILATLPDEKTKDPRIANPPANLDEELNGQLTYFIGMNDLDEVRRLLEKGARADTTNPDTGTTLLMTVEHEPMARLLIDHGANPKATDRDGGTVLHYAVSRLGALDLIPLYASLGVNPNQRGWDNDPPLFAAVDYFLETYEFNPPVPIPGEKREESINKGPHPKDVLKALTDAGADINAKDAHGNTVLMIAVVQNNADMVEILLGLGADKNATGKGGMTAKDIAYDLGHRFIFQMLE